jgi:hypothetical protein
MKNSTSAAGDKKPSQHLQPPQKTHSGFFRVSEEAMRRIAKTFDEPSVIRAATLAYVTFCRKANLRGRETFEDTVGSLAQDMAYSYRDAQKAVKLLESIGLIHVRRRKIPGTKANAPSIYSVNTLLHEAGSFGQDVGSLGESELRCTLPQLSQERPQEIHPYIPEILSI